MFPKNFEMSVSRLIRLLIAEGFIKPANKKSLEEVAEEYLEDLSDRNLVMVGKRGHSGKVKTYNIHDLLRDLCCREAQKDKFLRILKLDNPKISSHMKRERRLSIHIGTENEKICEVLRSATLRRSFLSYSYWESRRCVARRLNLLRILDVADYYSMDEILQLINSRYITCAISLDMRLDWSFLPLFWNLQTLVVSGSVSLPSEIWQMPQLRHLKMPRITLPDPADAQVDSQNITVLENLQTLTTLKDFIFREQVLKRIPNLKKLGVHCHMAEEIRSFHLSNLVFLHKLESLFLSLEGTWENIAFPVSLKKLALSSCRIPWEDMSIVGSLPRLAVLKLQRNAAEGRTWNPNAGEFSQLKFLMIDSCELEIWEADDTHFPRLEHLHLRHLKLKEMPMDFAQISTLQMIELNYCSYSLFKSAKAMTKEREDLGYEDIQVRSFPSQTPFLAQDNVVGFEDEARTLVKYLIENCEELEVVAIIGMPGLGKTTLAWKIYHDVRIQHEFPTLIWVHVSQCLNDIREVFLTILKELNTPQYRYLTEPELAEIVRSYLEERKFLLFLDDVWNAEAWSLIEAALPRSNRWGKVLITTQDEEVGAWLTNRNIEPHKLRFLNLYESWELLQLKVFGKLDECPSDLKLLGKHIAKQCGGVPLAVVVIAGILFEKLSTSSTDIKDEWEKVLTSLNACLENDEQKLTENIISLSYNKLPHDLRDCFLYLGMFPEQAEIPVWNLIRLWIAEGFVKQKLDNSLEEVAEDNLKNLINRNLVMVGKTKAKDHVRTCRVHHMISKFCKNQAAIANQNFFQEVKKTKEGNFDPPVSDIQKYHRLYIHSDVIDFLRTIPKAPGLHSFLCFSKEEVILSAEYDQSFPDAFNSLRVLDVNPIRFTKFPTEVTKLVDLRYIALSIDDFESLPEAFSKLWNLQTIKIDTKWRTFEIKAHIWKMVNLRHLKTKSAIILNGEGGGGENLQTLSRLSVRCCTEDVFNKASNLKNLGIRGDLNTLMKATCLEKLDRLQKLKLVHEPDVFPYVASEKPLHRLPHADRFPRNLYRLPHADRFPPNLRILTLSSTFLDWRHMTTLGMLLTLEVLKLKENAFIGKLWEAVDGDFPSLESLHIAQTDLEIWTASGDPFPKLKRLVLENCKKLEEIPSVLEKRREILHIERVTRPLVAQARRIELQKQEMQDSQFQAVKMSELASMQLISDLKRLQQDPAAGISGAPCGDYNIMLWNAVIFGPENTPWDGGTFKLTLQFPEDYPDKPPTVRFISRMFHPNIYADGSIDLDILHNQWSPIYDVTAILISIRSLLCDPNPNSLANPEAARLFSENNREYNRNVREIVEQSWTAD